MATNNAVNVGLSGSTGSGSFVGSTNPAITGATLTTPALGTPASGTLTSCTGYTIANLSDVAWTTFSATVTGFSSTTIVAGRYKKIGRTVHVSLQISGTSNANSFSVTNLPFASTASIATIYVPMGLGLDNGANQFPTMGDLSASSTTMNFYKNSSITSQSLTAWTTSGTKAVYGYFIYETDS